MDTQSAATGRYFLFSGAPELAAITDCTFDLPIYTYLPGGCSHFVARDGQKNAAAYAGQTPDPFPHVFFLRALRETTQIHAHRRPRVSRKNWRSI